MACDSKSAGIRSFGALVCMSCRAFFIRSIKDEAHKGFSCRAGSNPQSPACLINSKSRKSCRRCRFDQCLRVGMTIPEPTRTSRIPQVASPTSKMATSQAVTKPGHSLSVQNLLKENFCQAVLGNLREFLVNTTAFTSEDMHNIERFPHLHVRFTTKVYTDLARMSIAKFESTLRSLFQGRWHDLYMEKVIDDYQWFCANEMFLKMSGYPYDFLKYTDRIRLAKFNGPLTLEYILATKCGKVKDNELEFDHFISIMTNDPDEALSCKVKNIYCKVLTFSLPTSNT